MLGQSPLQCDDCRPDIVAAVGTKQDVEVSAHLSCVLRDASRLRRDAPQDDGVLGMASKKIRHPEALREAKPRRTPGGLQRQYQLTFTSFCRLRRPGGIGSPLARTRRPQLVKLTSPAQMSPGETRA